MRSIACPSDSCCETPVAKSPRQIRLQQAVLGSGMAISRLQGMKRRAQDDPPKPAVGRFPYPARTCAEWEDVGGVITDREMTLTERRSDAARGSKGLRDAIRRMA
jgi:hypothetical protein